MGSNDIDTDNFQFSCVNQSDVLLYFNLSKSNAVGCGNMHPRFIRILQHVILSYITYLFNSIITNSTLTLRWKCVKILPIPKSGTEFRSIAILCHISKVRETIFNSQMTSYIEANMLLTEEQS